MSEPRLPAIQGGKPIRPTGPPTWPIQDQDIQLAMQSAWEDGSWGQYCAEHVATLEAELAAQHQVQHVLTCSSGTLAIELALRAIKTQPDDEIILSAYDYPGNFLTIHALGAKPVLVDTDPENACMNPEQIAAVIGPQTRGILVSHLHGGLAPMSRIREIADTYNLKLIEDAAQCPGAGVEGRPAGSWGDIGVLSFGGSKLLTAGRGGAILTSDSNLFQRARLAQNRGNVVGAFSELQAVVLLPQLRKLAPRNAHRLRSVEHLRQGLSNIPGLTLFRNVAPECEPAFYKVGFFYDESTFGISRERFVTAMRAEGIAMDIGFRALHVQRSPKRFRRSESLQQANRVHQSIVILHHPILLGEEQEVHQIIEAIERIYAFRAQL